VVDIGSIGDVILSIYDFEGATKKNRPNLTVGTLIYGKIFEVSKYLRCKLSCISSKNKKVINL
jgi:exosome complex component RRP40